ncbi:MAG: S9 family peptidase [Pseudomonadota bacterium]
MSPDGRYLAMVFNEGNRRTVVVRDLDAPNMPVVGTVSDDIVRPNYLNWGSNNWLLITLSVPSEPQKARKDKEKNPDFDITEYEMWSRVIATDADMSNTVLLMQDEKGLHDNRFLSGITNFLPSDDDEVLIEAYQGYNRAQYRVNIQTGKTEFVTSGSYKTFRFMNDNQGDPRYRFDYLGYSKAIEILQFNGEEKWKKIDRIYLNKDDQDSISSVGLVALLDDDLVYRKRNEETGFYELHAISHDSGERRPVVSLQDRDVRGVIYNTRSDDIVGYTTEDDVYRSFYFDDATQVTFDKILAELGNYNIWTEDKSDDGRRVLVRASSPDDPLSYHLWDEDTQQLTRLASAFQELRPQDLSIPHVKTIEARDGLPIRTYLLLPEGYQQGLAYPTIILPHGGPHARSRSDYDMFAQFLSTRGYVVAQPNFRGSTGYGRDFEYAGHREWGGKMQEDVTDTAKHLVDQGITDPEKLCIVGISYGGYAALMGAIKTPELFQCAISINGVTDLPGIIKHEISSGLDKSDWQRLLYDRIGHPKKDRENLLANSPLRNADEFGTPVLIVAGTGDTVVPWEQSKRLAKALDKADKPHQLMVVSDARHNVFSKREDAVKVLERIEKFLGHYLQ